MPPKRKGGKDGGRTGKLQDRDSLRRAEAEIAALQRELEARSHEACEAKRQERVWRDTCAAHARALEAQRADLRDISSNATRQYRALQQETRAYVQELEESVERLTAQVRERESAAVQARADREAACAASRQQVEAVANQLQGLRSEFSELLRASLANVSKRLESRQRAEA